MYVTYSYINVMFIAKGNYVMNHEIFYLIYMTLSSRKLVFIWKYFVETNIKTVK